MSVRWRIALGIAVLWASLYALATLGGDFAFEHAPNAELAAEAALGPVFRWASAVNSFLVFLVLAVIVGRHPKLRAGEKVGWILAMLFLFPFVAPPLWYFHVWRSPA
jgi:hypothetical protein